MKTDLLNFCSVPFDVSFERRFSWVHLLACCCCDVPYCILMFSKVLGRLLHRLIDLQNILLNRINEFCILCYDVASSLLFVVKENFLIRVINLGNQDSIWQRNAVNLISASRWSDAWTKEKKVKRDCVAEMRIDILQMNCRFCRQQKTKDLCRKIQLCGFVSVYACSFKTLCFLVYLCLSIANSNISTF